MKSRCTICNHPDLNDINLAIMAGATLESLHRQYGPSKSALHRHKDHLQEQMRRSGERLKINQQLASLLKLSATLDHVQRGVEAAAAEGDTDLVFKGAQIGSRLIQQINKTDVTLEPDMVYRLISSPGFVSQDSILPTDPQIITALHQALVNSAFLPCPDFSPEIVAADITVLDSGPGETDPDGCGPETRYEENHATPEPILDPVPFSLTPDPCCAHPAAALVPAEKDPENKREKSGKVTKKKRRLLKKLLRRQQQTPTEANLPKNLNVGRKNAAPAAALEFPVPPDSLETRNSKLETAFTDPWPLLFRPPDPFF